jgi:ankyrin repeat protein
MDIQNRSRWLLIIAVIVLVLLLAASFIYFRRDTLLRNAVSDDNIQQARLALIVHADPNQRDQDDTTLLQQASASGRLQMASLLIRYGAAIDAQNAVGATALHLAVRENDLPMVKLLVQHHANLNLKTHTSWKIYVRMGPSVLQAYLPSGATPLSVAFALDNKPIINYLKAQGASL